MFASEMSWWITLLLVPFCVEIVLSDTDKGQSENIALPCITPNNNAGWCVELEQCELLKNKVIQNRGIITQFIKNSACDKDNQNLFCCGKYDDYIPYPVSAATCKTPNGDDGTCVDLTECEVLMKEYRRGNVNTRNFIKESLCSRWKNGKMPRVCCGKYGQKMAVAADQDTPSDIALPCKTPNNDEGWCIGLQQCRILHKKVVQNNGTLTRFASDSICSKEGQTLFCCGKHDDYIHNPVSPQLSTPSQNTDIFPSMCGRQFSLGSRIFNGEETEVGEFPWMVRLIRKYKLADGRFNACNGFLITQKHVVTAAHCVRNKDLNSMGPLVEVEIGEHDTSKEVDCSPDNSRCAPKVQTHQIQDIITHGGYIPESQHRHNDIALITLLQPVEFNDFVQPICILSKPPKSEGQIFSVTGWGKTETKESSDVQLKVQLKLRNQAECVKKYELLDIHLIESQFCAGEYMKDACSGDSGGPIMLKVHDAWYAAGIVSFGVGCGQEEWPGVYTSMPSFVDWIEKRIIRQKQRVGELSNRLGRMGRNRF